MRKKHGKVRGRDGGLSMLAVDSRGRLGMIRHREGGLYKGVTVFGGQPWATRSPRLLAREDATHLVAMNALAGEGQKARQDAAAQSKKWYVRLAKKLGIGGKLRIEAA